MVFGVNSDDWQHLLNHLSTSYLVIYTEDGVQCTLPDMESITRNRDTKTLALEIMLPGFTVNSHFFRSDEIEMDVLPEDVNSLEKANAVFRLMIEIASLLDKQVLLTPEFGSADAEKLRQLALCVAEPGSTAVRCLV